MNRIVCLILLCLINNSEVMCQVYGKECTLNGGGKGVCLADYDCHQALEVPKKQENPQECDKLLNITMICCPQRKSQIECSNMYKLSRPRRVVIGYGEKTLLDEFPHMAVLGYDEKDNVTWGCGGSLISDQFVLTAAHCVYSRDHGTVKWVRLGDLDINNTTDNAEPQDFTISAKFVHPSYEPPSNYHDIALLKLDRKVNFNDHIKPACLHVNKRIRDRDLIVTGWGNIEGEIKGTTHMLKASLNRVDQQTCNNRFRSTPKRRLQNGIVDDFQICAGHPSGKDTCRGDSGGPLQMKIWGFYTIIGVTSFGKHCEFENSVGVYTRVSNYIDWIENIVWPEEKNDNVYFQKQNIRKH